MKFLSFLVGALAFPLAAAAAPSQSVFVDDSPFEVFPLTPGLPVADDRKSAAAPVLLAQAGDPRVGQLEEQVRQLTGRIEELNFQILQMQENLRKMQEDVDFRLQDLEQKRGDAGVRSGSSIAEAPAPEEPGEPTAGRQQAGASAQSLPPPSKPGQGPGEPEKPLGSLVFDATGNIVGGTIDAPEASTEEAAPDSETVVAALPPAGGADEVYRNAYEFILSGDYGTAEAGFRDHIERFPDDPQTADAHYWLGESLLGQQRYRDAAEVFVAASKQYPDSRKAPDMLFKLGVSMAALKQREVACATFAKVAKSYPQASPTLKERVKQERALAGC